MTAMQYRSHIPLLVKVGFRIPVKPMPYGFGDGPTFDQASGAMDDLSSFDGMDLDTGGANFNVAESEPGLQAYNNPTSVLGGAMTGEYTGGFDGVSQCGELDDLAL
jgi:hypothetical protein